MSHGFLAGSVLLLAAAVPAGAAEFVHAGPNSGIASASVQCSAGYVARCHRAWTYTNPSGAMWSGEAGLALGPNRGAGYRTVTTPAGDTFRRAGAWRRW